MKKVSDIISTPVINLFESKYEGYVYNILFNSKQKKCKYFCINNEETGTKKIVEVNHIYSTENDCIFVKNSNCLELESNLDAKRLENISFINLKVYNLKGEYLGNTTDVTFNEKNNIESIILNNSTIINNTDVFNVGNEILLIDNNHQTNINKFKPKQKINFSTKTKESKVTILEPKINTNVKELNERLITDYRFLLGRIIDRNISTFNGEIIARSGTLVTKDIIKKASLYGKLVEIARYSKK